MSKNIKIKKGLNISLKGEAIKEIVSLPLPETAALKPPDFINVTPKLLVNEGDEVTAGTPLFFDTADERIRFCSPVSGEVAEIVRGEKRRIMEVRILADKEIRYTPVDSTAARNFDRSKLIDFLLYNGAWPLIRQRPYGTIASPNDEPKSIFIPAFDTNPLAPDYNFLLKDSIPEFQAGVTILKKLTSGKVHINIAATATTTTVFTGCTGIQLNRFEGPHPAGNVGVQIHHLDPISKGEKVWWVNPQDVVIIGRLFTLGRLDCSKIIALTGSEVLKPAYYSTITGAAIKNITRDGGLAEKEHRIISGNVLTGHQISPEGYLGFYDAQLTVIPEGNSPQFMGWLAPGLEKFSLSRTFLSWLQPHKKYTLNTNLYGEERPFVVSGEYEKVFPMDIYPVQLLKSILIEDVELMEQLGIYEVVEEDFALCEFICTSKIESQEIIRRGLNLIQKELG